MKTLKHSILAIISCCIATSCQQLPEDNESTDSTTEQTLTVKVRSSEDAEIDYPLYLYAFNKSGKLAASQTIDEEGKDMALSLSEGDFQVVAVAGVCDDYELPESPSLKDAIVLSNDEGADTPLMIGKADIGVSRNAGTTAEIALSYVVAQLNVKLKNVPTDVSTVQLSISPLHSSLSMGGEYGGDAQKVKVNCTLNDDGTWSAEPTYIFPGSGKETTFSVYFKKEDGTELTYGYTYQGTPEANHPFNITGSFADGIIVGGSFEITGWEEAINVEFTFGANVVPDEEETESDEPEIDLSSVPEVGSIWNGTIVADIGEADENGVNLLLMSLDEWEATTSDISDITDGYSVNELTGWRLPTHDEAALLRARFSGTGRLELNELIEDYDTDLYGLADGEKERYLCLKNDAYYSFRFVSGTTTTKAGEKRTYYVRLVKTYSMALEQ